MTEIKLKHIIYINDKFDQSLELWTKEIKKEIEYFKSKGGENRIRVNTTLKLEDNGNIRGYVIFGIE